MHGRLPSEVIGFRETDERLGGREGGRERGWPGGQLGQAGVGEKLLESRLGRQTAMPAL